MTNPTPGAETAADAPVADANIDPHGGTSIDPRAPRFGAGITAALLLLVIALDLGGASLAAGVVLAAVCALFAWGAFAGIRRHPYGRIFAAVVRPRLSAPDALEDPAPPTFAQGVGFVVTLVGLVIAIAGVPFAIAAAAAIAFVAAFLNSVFGYCIGCQVYLLLVRLRLVRAHRVHAE